jgi:hypothetical protein
VERLDCYLSFAKRNVPDIEARRIALDEAAPIRVDQQVSVFATRLRVFREIPKGHGRFRQRRTAVVEFAKQGHLTSE